MRWCGKAEKRSIKWERILKIWKCKGTKIRVNVELIFIDFFF